MPVAFWRAGSIGTRCLSSEPASTWSAGVPMLTFAEHAPAQHAASTSATTAASLRPALKPFIERPPVLRSARRRQRQLARAGIWLLGTLEVGLGPVHLGRQRVHGLLHIVEGLELVRVDLVHGRVHVVEPSLHLPQRNL